MRLNLRPIKDFPGKHADFSFQICGLECGGFEQPPLNVSGCVKNASGILTLDGKVEGVLTLSCDRCGTRFERKKTLCVSGILSESQNVDEGVFPFDGSGVELDDIFIPEFMLDMDMKILCADDCTGGDLKKYLYVEEDE